MSSANGHSDGRVALITGGARGIGRGIAVRLASDGLDVAVADLPSMRSELEAVADEIRGAGRRAAAIDVDVSDASQVDAMVCHGRAARPARRHGRQRRRGRGRAAA
jgi:NAD(P)-dependent dehydrogenase (short-subunit alcohol dehydrogenase family)